MLITDQVPDMMHYERVEERVQVLAEYLYGFRHHLNHVLSNLDENNLSKELREQMAQMSTVAKLAADQLSAKAAKVAAWPVGCVYMTADEAQDPAQALGGRWEKLSNIADNVYAWKRLE